MKGILTFIMKSSKEDNQSRLKKAEKFHQIFRKKKLIRPPSVYKHFERRCRPKSREFGVDFQYAQSTRKLKTRQLLKENKGMS